MANDDAKPPGAGATAAKSSEETDKSAEEDIARASGEATAQGKASPTASDKASEPQRSAASPLEDIQPVPVLTNANRPPSVNSTHSGASGGNVGAVPTTTTSRRGGRIRSRSPATMMTRPPGDFQDATARDPRSHSPKNPSSAAAAAAAAAKALSKGGRSKSGWGGSVRQDQRGEHPMYYDQGNAYGGPQGQGWPNDGGDGRGYGQDARHSQSIHRGRPYEQGYGDAHQRSTRRHPSEYHGQYDGQAEYDPRRYGYADSSRGGRGGDVPFEQRSPRMRPDYFSGPSGMAPVDGNPPAPPPVDNAAMPMSYASPTKTSSNRDAETPSTLKRRGGTSRVIGTPTPIHVPRAADPPNPQFTSQSNAAAVFRGRPDDAEAAKPPAENLDDETPLRLLRSLRTPTTSFDENRSARAPPLSPEEPPKIQHAHQQRGDQPLIFEVNRSQ